MPEFGIAGVGQSGQYDQRINDLYRRQEADQRAEQLAASKAALFSKDVEFNNAANQFDSPRVKQYAQSKIQEIGAFYRNNPDLQYNPAKLAQLKIMTSDLKNNKDLVRGLASDTAYKQYLADMQEVAKNPSQHDTEAYQAIQQQWKNYEQFGNQKGQQAATEEGLQPFMYSRPQSLVDLNAGLPEIGGRVKNLEYRNGKNPGEFYADIPEAALNEAVKGVYADPAMRRSVELFARKQNWSPEQTTEFVKQKIKSGVDNQYHPGDPLALERLNLQRRSLGLQEAELAAKLGGEPSVTTWDDLRNPSNRAGQIDQKAASDMFGEGNFTVKGNGKNVDLTGQVWKSDGNFIKGTEGKYKNVPFLSGYIELPVEEARKQGLIIDPWGPGDAEPAPGFTDKVQVREGEKNGKKYQYVHVKHSFPIDPNNPSHKSRYEQLTMPSKLVPGSENRFKSRRPPQGSQVDEAGNVFAPNGQYVGKQSDFE